MNKIYEPSIVSFVVPSYNRGESLSKMLKKLIFFFKEYGDIYDIDIVISDDSDSSVSFNSLSELSCEFQDIVIYEKNNNRIGFAKNLIKAINLAKGRYLFLLADEDAVLTNDSLLNLVKDLQSDKYWLLKSNLEKNKSDESINEYYKLHTLDVLGELRHFSGLIIRREIVHEAIASPIVMKSIDNVLQYPQVPIILFLASKYKIYKTSTSFVQAYDDGNSGSNWSSNKTLLKYHALQSRIVQAEEWVYFMSSMSESYRNNNNFPFIRNLKKASEEWFYMLIESGIQHNYDKNVMMSFYKRSAINSIKWLVNNMSIKQILKLIYSSYKGKYY
jgi:hypothetical protein